MKRLKLSKLTIANLDREMLDRINGGTIVIDIPGVDIPSFNDYSCWWGGTCGTSRCSEDGKCGGTSACTVGMGDC